jgi:transcription antitermination protein NusB
MLNRRYLRIKVYQSLYAFWQSDDASAARIEKELFLSIERTFDLYVGLLMLFGEMRRLAELRIEDRMKKLLPTPEDLNPSRRFVDNPVLMILAESPKLQAEASKRRVSWVGHNEMLTKLYKELESSETYKNYMALPSTTPKQDQQAVLNMFIEHIANFEQIHDHYEAKSITWLEDLDLACTLVKRTIEEIKPDQGDLALNDLAHIPADENAFVSTLFRRAIDQGPEHEEAISAKASNWDTDRIAITDMILMKMALTEAREFTEIPVKVTLNEYIEVAKAYSTPKSKNFVNGILDKLFAEMKESGQIRKVGRGLLES